MQETSPRDSAGLRMFAASSEPSADPAPIREWISSMKTMRSSLSVSSLRMPLRRSSNWPRYFVPATTSERSSAMIRFCARKTGTPAFDDALRESFDDRRLADARLAQQDRVVLGATRQDLHDPLELLGATDERIEGTFAGERRQIATELREERQLLLLLAGVALLGDRQHFFAHAVGVETVLGEDPHRQAALDPRNADQQVLRAHRAVQHALGLVRRVGQDLLRLLGQRQLGRRRDALDEDPLALDLASDLLRLDRKRRSSSPTDSSPSRRMPSSTCSDSITRLPSLLAS